MPLPNDPLLSSQWYLRNTTAGQLDLSLFAVWNPTEGPAYTGAGILNVVVGDGFDYTHPDIAPNYDTTLDFDYVGANDFDPFGTATDLRGTTLLGILGGAANNGGMVGVAFGSQMIGYRVEASGSDIWLSSLASAISQSAASAFADVTLMGQSFMGQSGTMFGAGYSLANLTEVDTAIGAAVSSGRDGLGTILVRGAGDGRTGSSSTTYDVNADHWGNDTRQIIVAAVTETGAVTSYSSAGAPILVSAFGSQGSILTSDRVGAPGLAPGDFTTTAQGTDIAAAMVAGVVDLMLEANPRLNYRQVQTILANSAVHTGSEIGTAHSGFESADWGWNNAATWNGGGLHFSNDYGFGLVDARAAVRMAETWTATGAATNATVTSFLTVLSSSTVIPDGNLIGVTFFGSIGSVAPIERVSLSMSFASTYLSDLEVYLTSPDGTTSMLIADAGGAADFSGTWTFESQAFRGEDRSGQWSVRVVDDGALDTITVSNIALTILGPNSLSDRYIYTDEYSDYVGIANHLAAVSDANGGTDTVDASAVTSGSTIRLDRSAGIIDGVATSFTNVEHAIGGDGNDTLVGYIGANILIGNRGRDLLSGGDGNDSLYGGTGIDTLEGGAGDNLLEGGAGNDIYIVTSIGDVIVEGLGGGRDVVRTALSSFSISGVANVEDMVATGSDNVAMTGNELNNELFGNAGSNVLTGNAGNDTLFGGAGNDVLHGTSGINLLFGEDGNDQIFAGTGGDFIGGGAGNDLIRGSNGADTIYGGLGNDDLAGGAGNDEVFGSAGSNVIYAGLGNDTVQGGAGSDTIYGGAGKNQLFGNDGNDLIFTSADGDFVGGGAGSDVIRGAAGADTIFGGLGNDDIGGGAGNDLIFGSAGANTIWGGLGNDTINGGTGKDVMSGGPGADVFVFASSAAIGIGLARDVISDFTPGVDDINLRALTTKFNGAAGLSGGGVKSFFYFATGGILIGDQNGDGVADWVLELTGAPVVTANDFLL